MYAMPLLRTSVAESTAADPAVLGAVLAMKVALVLGDWDITDDLTIASLTLASFVGSTALVAGAAPQLAGVDPATGRQVVEVKAPAGGWRWEATVAPAPAQVVTGFILMDNASAVLIGAEKLPAPVSISAIGHFVELGNGVKFTLPNPPVS